jgi:hypothetical protein
MKQYTVTLYVKVEAENIHKARGIAFNLGIVPRNKDDKDKVTLNPRDTEVDELIY